MVCGCCGRVQMGWYDRRPRRVRDLSCGDTRVYLEVEVRRLDCRACGKVKREQLDFLADNPLYTKRFAHYVGRRCRGAPIKEVAAELKLDWHTVKALDQQYMEAQLKHAGSPAPKAIGIDEISIRKGHTDLIMRGKVRTPVEFGHKVFLAESAQGLITQYEVLNGNPSDENHVEPSLSRHEATFGSAPRLYGSDRGFFSEKNLAACARNGVEVVCIPQRGGKKTAEREDYEKSREFKKGQRFRAGIEGRISVLFRGRGMKRCLAEGRERFELLVGAAVFVNNLLIIASLLKTRSSDQRQAA